MILNHIHHKMPIYKDCTLGELLGVGVFVFLSLSGVLSVTAHLLFGFAWVGFAGAILLLVPITRLLLSGLQKIKYGKPYGYYQQWVLKQLQHTVVLRVFLKLPYMQRQGKWSVRRLLNS